MMIHFKSQNTNGYPAVGQSKLRKTHGFTSKVRMQMHTKL